MDFSTAGFRKQLRLWSWLYTNRTAVGWHRGTEQLMTEALVRTHQGAADRYHLPAEPQHRPSALLPSMSQTFVSYNASEGGLCECVLIWSKGRLKSTHGVR